MTVASRCPIKWVQGDCLISPPYLIDNVVINDIFTNGPSTPTSPGTTYGHDKDRKSYGNIYSKPFGRK